MHHARDYTDLSQGVSDPPGSLFLVPSLATLFTLLYYCFTSLLLQRSICASHVLVLRRYTALLLIYYMRAAAALRLFCGVLGRLRCAVRA
jgi:hypothetical protein